MSENWGDSFFDELEKRKNEKCKDEKASFKVAVCDCCGGDTVYVTHPAGWTQKINTVSKTVEWYCVNCKN